MKLELTTNNHDRHFIYRHDVPAKILADQFDYLDDDTFDGFICYKGHWYHTSCFMRLPDVISEIWDNDSPLREWHGYASDSYFSGVVIKISDDGETYRIGTYIQRG